jgi:glycosyltransferase involved in cell wall biosynthesis
MKEKVSIIMATYNRAHLIGDMLDSILKQGYPNWECIIVNDGGTDNTDEIVESYVKKDTRFRYYHRPSSYAKGLPGCRNYGLDIATGFYVVFFDDDDSVHPDLLTLSVKALHSSTFDFCQYQKQWFFESIPTPEVYTECIAQQTLTYADLTKLITYTHAIASCTVLWKRSFLNERFDEHLQYAEEWEYYNRLFLQHSTFSGLVLSNVLYYNRKHPSSNTGEFFNFSKKRMDSKSLASYRLLCTYLQHVKHPHLRVIHHLLNILIRNRSKELYLQSLNAIHLKGRKRLYKMAAYTLYPLYYPLYTLFHKLT